MGISIALFAVFALFLAILAGGSIKVFAAKDANGNAQPLGCLSGCVLGLVLAVLGTTGLVAFLLSIGAHTVARSLPFESVTVLKDSRLADSIPVAPDPWRPLHVVFEVDGHDAPIHELVELVHRLSEGTSRVRAVPSQDAQGRPLTWVDVALPVCENDLREMERELRKLVPSLRLEHGVQVRFKGAHRDW